MKRFIFAIVAMMFLMVGCAGQDLATVTSTYHPDGTLVVKEEGKNNTDTASYYGSLDSHSDSEATRIGTMTEKVMAQESCVDCTDEGKAYAQIVKSMMIAFGPNFRPAAYQGKQNKTWIDVADNAIKPLIKLGETATITGGVVSIADSVMGNSGKTEITMGDGGSIDGAFNKQSYESSASTLYGDADVHTEVTNEGASGSSGGSPEEGEEGWDEENRCRDNESCGEGYACSKNDGSVGQCIPEGE